MPHRDGEGRVSKGPSSLLVLSWVLLSGLPLIFLVSKLDPSSLLAALSAALVSEDLRRSLGFGLAEAGGSLFVALVVGLPGAFLVARYKFPGRRLLRGLAAVPFCLPSILAALGFVLWYGKAGVLNRLLMWVFSLDEPPISVLYSFLGLCLVQGFYNFPLVLDIVGSALERLPTTRIEAARSLGAGPLRAFFGVTLPSLAPALVEAGSFAFLFSFFSFVIIMIFGPPGLANPETEIFRLLRFEGDRTAAAALAILQSALALALLSLLSFASLRASRNELQSGEGRNLAKPGALALASLIAYAFLLLVFFVGPLFTIGLSAFTERRGAESSIFFSLGAWLRLFGSGRLIGALLTTLATALPSALLATLLGLVFGGLLRSKRELIDVMANLPLAISAVVAAAGWQLLFPRGGPQVLILIQALMAAPFAIRSSASALASLSPEPLFAARSLGAGRLRAFFGVELRSILPITLSSAAFSFSLAAGDATTPLVLGLPDFETLPLAVYRLTGAYRYSEACAVGIVLALVTGLVFFAKEGRKLDA